MTVAERLVSTNPADVEDVVFSGPAADAPRRGRAIQQIGRIVEADKEALEGRRVDGQTVPGEMPDPARGLHMHPTIVAGVRIDDELASTETFGPLVAVARLDG
ncbi:MAG TPA: aldehyde dehydrogenase family protein [Baekduia sp.]|nr:aldehyde dehydrogenase family protein [Baekduia sp.]